MEGLFRDLCSFLLPDFCDKIEKWIEKNIERIEYEKIYNIYRAVRDKKEIKEKIDIKQAEELTSQIYFLANSETRT